MKIQNSYLLKTFSPKIFEWSQIYSIQPLARWFLEVKKEKFRCFLWQQQKFLNLCLYIIKFGLGCKDGADGNSTVVLLKLWVMSLIGVTKLEDYMKLLHDKKS